MPTPEEAAEQQRIYDRFCLLLAELNLVLRGLAMGGVVVRLDVIVRADPLTGGERVEVIVDGIPEGLE